MGVFGMWDTVLLLGLTFLGLTYKQIPEAWGGSEKFLAESCSMRHSPSKPPHRL